MSDVEYKPVGKQDERLEFVKDMCRQAVEGFIEAMKKMEFGMRFKAFDFLNIKDEEVNSLSDLISTAIAIEINKQAKDTLDTITYSCKMEKSEEGHSFWLNATKEKPDYDKVPKMEETPIEDITIPKIQDSQSESEKTESDSQSDRTDCINAVNYIV